MSIRTLHHGLKSWTARVIGAALAMALVGPLPVSVLAQEAVPCGLLGTCVAGATTGSLLGHPDGTLGIRTYHPWERVVKGTAASAWAPIEAEARAFLSVLHGVPNDSRLPAAAIDELRALIFARLMDIAERHGNAATLSAVEQTALNAFRDAVIARRVAAAQRALAEYYRWSNHPCGYVVPAGFGFDAYVPGPACQVGHVGSLTLPPRPPTAQQFSAYGAALASQDIQPADAQAAFARMDQSLAVVTGIAGAALVGGIATIAAVSSATVAAVFAGMAGSAGIAGATTIAATSYLGFKLAAPALLATTGIAVAATFPATIILAAVVTAVATVQIIEDSQVFPTLQTALTDAYQTPNLVTMAADDAEATELFTAFMTQTLPDYAAEREAQVVPQPPTAPQPGDKVFDVDGTTVDLIQTLTPGIDRPYRQTFMSGGWFVTRTGIDIDGPWSPWQWSLSVTYATPNNRRRVVGIQPGGFLDVDYQATSPTATRTTQFRGLLLPGQVDRLVQWGGNRAPVLSPTAAAAIVEGMPAAFSSGVSDPDQHAVEVRWFVEDPSFVAANPDPAYCGFAPAATNPANGLPYACPWRPYADAGGGITHTFARAGDYTVLVAARDSQGAVSSQQFLVRIGSVPPGLTADTSSSNVTEGQPLAIAGSLDFPMLPGGFYGTQLRLSVDWGDGTSIQREYPCSFNPALGPACTILNGGLYQGPAPGPWPFEFSRSVSFTGDGQVPVPMPITVTAITREGVSTVIARSVAVNNVAPVFTPNVVCGAVSTGVSICTPGADRSEVPAGGTYRLSGWLRDIPSSAHFVKVFWGDGHSSALLPGCSGPGCPEAIPNTLANGTILKQMSLTHAYQAPGTYSVRLLITDGGPGGSITYDTTAVAFGLGELQGPSEVTAGTAATFGFSQVLPANASLTPTVSCGVGTLAGITATDFTCAFADVAAPTATDVGISGTIAGTAFSRTLPVEVLPRPLSLSALSGPDTVTGGASATYAYSATASPFATVDYTPVCGHGQLIGSTPGASFTCRFNDVATLTVAELAITATDSNGSIATSTFPVEIMADLAPPVLTLPPGVAANSTGHDGAPVAYSASAHDIVSGPSAVTCSPTSGSIFGVGSTTVSCQASDWKGNQATGSFAVVVADVTAPTLTLPPQIEVDAAGPAGAVVTFAASAVDATPSEPTVSCTPASGATFAIGVTPVSCAVTDAAGNQATGQFAVTVRSPAAQLSNLRANIEAMALKPALRIALLSLVNAATASVVAERPGACAQLWALAKVATAASGKGLTAAQASFIVAEATRVRAVLGCGR